MITMEGGAVSHQAPFSSDNSQENLPHDMRKKTCDYTNSLLYLGAHGVTVVLLLSDCPTIHFTLILAPLFPSLSGL